MQKRIVSVVGIGEVGSLVVALLLAKFQDIIINLVDIKPNLEGRLLDFRHAAAARNNRVTWNSKALLSGSDFIIHSAGYGISRGADRDTVASLNRNVVYQIYQNLKLKPSVVIIAITNPVELVAEWISELFDHKIRVVGTGTSLDSIRLKYLLSKYLEVDVDEVKALVLGQHGKRMTPIQAEITVQGRPIAALLTPTRFEQIIKELKLSATTIRKTESASKYGVAQCTVSILSALCEGRSLQLPLSVGLNNHYKKRLRIKTDGFLSLPCKINRLGIKIINQITLSATEKEQLRNAALHIQKLTTETGKVLQTNYHEKH